MKLSNSLNSLIGEKKILETKLRGRKLTHAPQYSEKKKKKEKKKKYMDDIPSFQKREKKMENPNEIRLYHQT